MGAGCCDVDAEGADADNGGAKGGTLMLAGTLGTTAGDTVGVTPTGTRVLEEQSGGAIVLQCV
jgi:hypothetical protein